MQTINEKTPQAEITKKVAIASGKSKKQAPHPDPKDRTEELARYWAETSSQDSLPLKC